MNLNIRLLVIFLTIIGSTPSAGQNLEQLVKTSAKLNGFKKISNINNIDMELVGLGQELFESEDLSLNANISCQTCHLDEFGSSDGIPIAVGIGGEGEGPKRGLSNGALLPRNTLPLWGRGNDEFNVFFWDGRVDFSENNISAFGEEFPSNSPLITAIHLPVLEIREMLIEDEYILKNKKEATQNANNVYKSIINNIKINDPDLYDSLLSYYKLESGELSFNDAAKAIAEFIKEKFRIKETKFHRYVFSNDSISDAAANGALLFYGKGKCSTCHSGHLFSDLNYYSIALPQLGFGKNGFGVDYGRYNVTHDPNDLYKFRTPPLYNVTKTAPYGHSGSISDLKSIISFHQDPLGQIDFENLSSNDRLNFYKTLIAASENIIQISTLNEQEINDIISFLKTLEY